MKLGVVVAALIIVVAWDIRGRADVPAAPAPSYEFKVMSMLDLVGNSPAGLKKIGAMMVTGPNGVTRTDLDVPDYQAAFDRLGTDGWEPVTVNRSDYWVFRRAKR